MLRSLAGVARRAARAPPRTAAACWRVIAAGATAAAQHDPSLACHRAGASTWLTHVRHGSSDALADTSEYDLVIVGGGSGGVAAAARAVSLGKRVAVVENGPMGGVCVNVGCVPKKMMVNAATVGGALRDAEAYGFTGTVAGSFDMGKFKASRDAYIGRLNAMYQKAMDIREVDTLHGWGRFEDPHTLLVEGDDTSHRVTAQHFVVATGSHPTPFEVPGEELTIDSDGFFDLETLPKKAAVVGAGYIAVELAGVLHELGVDTTLVARGSTVLRKFDSMVQELVTEHMAEAGINMVMENQVVSVNKDASGTMTLDLLKGPGIEGFDTVITAIGRMPCVSGLGLEEAGVEVDGKGNVVTDDFDNTSARGIYALGDVAGKAMLTPTAIASARILMNRLFGGEAHAGDKLSFENVPTVVFSHPPVGTVGLSEEEARERFGDANVSVFSNSWVNLYHAVRADKPASRAKMVCAGPEQRVVGLHIVGEGADEMLQGFGVAVKAGLTKAQFDACVAIHPTAAEEVVTMKPWAPQLS